MNKRIFLAAVVLLALVVAPAMATNLTTQQAQKLDQSLGYQLGQWKPFYGLKLVQDGTFAFDDGGTMEAGSTSGTTLISLLLTPKASTATDGVSYHKLLGIGDQTGTTAFGWGDVTKPTVGLMASFGRTAIATSAFTGTDTAGDFRAINKLANDAAYSMQGAYIKAKNYSTGTVGTMKGLYVESVNDGTATANYVLDLGTDGTTPTADIRFHDTSIVEAGKLSGTTLSALLFTPKASTATASVSYHKLFGVGDQTGTTAFGMGDVTKPTAGIMASFGRTAIATSSFTGTDTGLDVRAINKLANDAAYSLQGAYVKAKNYSTGTVGTLKGLYIEAVNDGTASAIYPLDIGTDGTTPTADIRLHNGETIDNNTDGTLNLTATTIKATGNFQTTGTATVGSTPLTGANVPQVAYHTVTTAEMNAGHEILPAVAGLKYRVIDWFVVANGAATTSTDATGMAIYGTQSTSAVALVTIPKGSLTQSAVNGRSTTTVLADSASFAQNDANTAITCKTVTAGAYDLADTTSYTVCITYLLGS